MSFQVDHSSQPLEANPAGRQKFVLSSMSSSGSSFPLAEGLGIFVGIVAWDLLVDGKMEILKAIAVAVPCTLVWFAARCWKNRRKNKPR